MKNIFELCQPRADVLGGGIKESDFAADLALVLRGDAPKEYADPATFFANTHPTVGLRNLLANVCRRLSGAGGEASAIFRLDTQYGGGKTHALIALSHAARGAASVPNISEFLDPKLLPKSAVSVAAFDGENADPVNGRPLKGGVRAFTPWGELAFALGGKSAYEKVRASDEQRVAPGADTIRELFDGKPALILLDELSIYLRKVKGRKDAEQLTPFLTSLFKAIESSPGAALVFTLAIGKQGKATDAYSDENQWVAARLDEAESVAARKATLLDPTAESEVAQVLRRRLFAEIDDAGAKAVVEAYRKLWHGLGSKIPEPRLNEDRPKELSDGYPFHPALISALTDKLSTLHNFQRVRGMLRLLTQTIARLWKQKPPVTHAVHLHHIDPSFGPTRSEVVTRLEMGAFDPAIRNDVASSDGGVSLAQQLDAKDYSGLPPYASFVARTILWHTFAFNEHLKGLTVEELRYAILGPELDASFLDDARQKFVADSAYLDDRPGAPLRFLTEANLTMMIRRQEVQVDVGDARTQLNDRIRETFKKGPFELVPFASGPYEVDDGIGNGRPYLVVLSYDAATVRPDALRVPDLVERIFTTSGNQGAFRKCKNNVVFLVGDDSLRDEMKAKMVRRLALEAMRTPERLKELAEHQQNKLQELYRRSEQEVALAIQQCYRHLFYPTRNEKIEGATVDLGHNAFDVQSASERPGDGQNQIARALLDSKKLLRAEDAPSNPRYVRDQTILKRGEVTTSDLRDEFRKEVRLPIMLGDENFVKLVREGVTQGEYVYRSADLVYGQGDPYAEIKIDDQSFVMTMVHAKEKDIWPRAPKSVKGSSYPPTGETKPLPLRERTAQGESPPPPSVGTPGVLSFQAEAPLREALTQIWEQAKQKGVAKLASLRLRVFEVGDAFKLLSSITTIAGAEKKIQLSAEYETTDGGTLQMEFSGVPQDAGPLKEFLEPQFRAAKEKRLNVQFLLAFADGLAIDGDPPKQVTEKLTRFATGAAYVEAYAEAKK